MDNQSIKQTNNQTNNCHNLINDQHLNDVTLLANDGKQIEAHRVILSSSSNFFRNIFLMNPHKNPLIYMKGITFVELQSIVNSIYLGECQVVQEDLDKFLAMAKDLQVAGLKEQMRNFEKPFNEEASELYNPFITEFETSLDETEGSEEGIDNPDDQRDKNYFEDVSMDAFNTESVRSNLKRLWFPEKKICQTMLSM